MKTIKGYDFPETTEELEAWTPSHQVRALASKVLAVSRTRCEGAWSAYINAVPGRKHDDETEDVLDYGSKLPEKLARAIFDMPKELPYN